MTEEGKKNGVKIVMIGDSGVGKTCVISRYTQGVFLESSTSTNGASYSSKKIKYEEYDEDLIVDIWDTAGQEKYRSLTKFFYKGAVIAILVYDITIKDSFENIKNFWYNEITDNGKESIILALVGNKCDLYEDEQVNEDEAREYAKSINAVFALTSAQSNTGIEKLFYDVGKRYLVEKLGKPDLEKEDIEGENEENKGKKEDNKVKNEENKVKKEGNKSKKEGNIVLEKSKIQEEVKKKKKCC